MRCPRCDHELAGTPAKCSECNGCWVSPADVNKTVLAVAGPSKLECPECYAKMELVVVKGVQLDRCVKHGVWFDIGEISDVLRKTGKLPRDGVAREDKPSTGSKVAEGAASVGAAILEVVATAIDIVT